jgi:hypothetical protein
MVFTQKAPSDQDQTQIFQNSYNTEDASITVNGFLAGKVGRKVTVAISTTSVSNDTETYTFLESGVTLFVYFVIYTDGSRSQMLSAERTA